jgi:hypothetical protein
VGAWCYDTCGRRVWSGKVLIVVVLLFDFPDSQVCMKCDLKLFDGMCRCKKAILVSSSFGFKIEQSWVSTSITQKSIRTSERFS